ncbi:hypothetical protein HZB89_02325, partial [archaeon]|nr:hypothetical protein [archaeon]
CGEQLAVFVAKNIELILNNKRDYKDFKISFSTPQENVFQAKQKFRELIGKVIAETVESGEGLFDVVEADNPDTTEIEGCGPEKPEDCKGFYLNLDLAKLKPEEYEQLPKIRVASSSTSRIVEEPVFPYANFKIFIPIRLFRVMAHAYALAHAPDGSGTGLLDTQKHNEFEEWKLGVCDAKKCGYRKTPLNASGVESTLENEYCLGSSAFLTQGYTPSINAINFQLNDLSGYFSGSPATAAYKPWVAAGQELALKLFTEDWLINYLNNNSNWAGAGNNDFIPEINSVDAIATARNSKKIQGLSVGGNEWSSCTELSRIEAELEFTEKNPLYKVDDKEKDKKYKVAIIDYYDEFDSGQLAGVNANDWTCMQYAQVNDVGEYLSPVKCAPA